MQIGVLVTTERHESIHLGKSSFLALTRRSIEDAIHIHVWARGK